MPSLTQDMRVMNAVAAQAHTFTGWLRGRIVSLAPNLLDAEQAALLHLNHKDTLYIHEAHTGTGGQFLHVYRVRKGAAKWQRNPVSGLSERVEPMTLDKIDALPVASFEPKRAFDAFRDDPVGLDGGLIEMKEARHG